MLIKRTYELLLSLILLQAVLCTPLPAVPNLETGCPVETSLESKITIGDRVFLEKGNDINAFDMTTGTCLQCHDGTIAQGILYNNSTNSNPQSNFTDYHNLHTASNSHPVDVSYPRNNREYINSRQLDKRLVLSDGKITCFTCHAGDYDLVNLSLSNERSRLCLSCHIK